MIRKTCEPQFLAGDLWKPGEYPQEIRNDQSTVSKKIASNVLWRIGNQEQTGTVADRFAASVVPNRRHLVTLVEAKVSNRGTKANLCRCIISGKKENFERLTEIFKINFRKLSVLFRLWTGISGNFGWMERGHHSRLRFLPSDSLYKFLRSRQVCATNAQVTGANRRNFSSNLINWQLGSCWSGLRVQCRRNLEDKADC